MTNTHRINSLHLSNLFIYDLDCSPHLKISKFVRLERLIVDNIQSKYLQSLLHQLISLPLLSSLTITSIDRVKNKNAMYREIFRLPALKYCELSLERSSNPDPLPVTINVYSSIEYLIINNPMYLKELDSLLTYVPQLRRLSLYSLQEYWEQRTKLSSLVLKYLTHVSLNMNDINFDDFEQLTIDLFQTVQVLRISISNTRDATFTYDKSWEQLILYYMPNLRIFDIRLEYWLKIRHTNNTSKNNLKLDAYNHQFTSPFWIEREWFFTQQFYQSGNGNTIFYSIDPYRY